MTQGRSTQAGEGWLRTGAPRAPARDDSALRAPESLARVIGAQYLLDLTCRHHLKLFALQTMHRCHALCHLPMKAAGDCSNSETRSPDTAGDNRRRLGIWGDHRRQQGQCFPYENLVFISNTDPGNSPEYWELLYLCGDH